MSGRGRGEVSGRGRGKVSGRERGDVEPPQQGRSAVCHPPQKLPF